MNVVHALVVIALVAAGTCSCASSSAAQRSFTGRDNLYSVSLDGRFKSKRNGPHALDRLFERDDGAVFVGIIQEAQPLTLHELDTAVSVNLDNGGFPEAQVVDVVDTTLDRIPAHRSEMTVSMPDVHVVMFNTHGATSTHSVQLMVWGPAIWRREMLDLIENLERGGFRFQGEVMPFDRGSPYSAEDVAVFIPVSRQLPQWSVTRRGELNGAAELELRDAARELYFMAFSTEDAGELRAVQDGMASEIKQYVQSDHCEPRDVVEGPSGITWAQSGLIDPGVGITYRMRVLKKGAFTVRLYCWGATANPEVASGCQQILESVDPQVPSVAR